MRVLVTGGAGFIGSHLCDSLVFRGDKVTILDNLTTGTKKNIAHLEGKVNLFIGDIRDRKLVEGLVAKNDLILHMGAAVGVENILGDPIESISINYLGSETVLKAASKFEKRIIIASTSEIYGKNPNMPLSETDDRVVGAPQNFRWTYSDAKALEESTAFALFLKNKLKVTTTRLFNIVGPRQSGNYGMVFPRFVESAMKNKPIMVYGDGTQSRVFCHVNDSVNAILGLSDNSESVGEVYNVGGREEISIHNLARKVIEILNSNSKIIFINYKKAYTNGFEDMVRRVPDLTKITNLLNWAPQRSLNEIIYDVANSFKS